MLGRCAVLAISAALLALAPSTVSVAGPYEDGDAAFRRKEYGIAMGQWLPLAQGGDARAQVGIASIYLNGLGIAPDHSLALSWCKKAADKGEPNALYLLGSMYRDGHGVERDAIRALALLRKAADQNFHWAQYNLGLMYFMGEGIPPDYPEAYYWLGIAAAENNNSTVQSTAAFLLDEVAAKLTPEEIEETKHRIRDWKPAQSQP
jgi:uncharacterized protein